jgi:hypothetical protein
VRRIAALLVLLVPAIAAADETEILEGRYGVSARMRVGTATAPFYVDGLPEARAEFTQARTFVLAAFVDLGRYSVGGRLPAAPSTVRQPAGSYADEKSVGNPELFAEAEPWRRGRLTVAMRLGVGIPVADHGAPDTLVKSRALAISDAIDGWLDRELYVPGVLPITGSLWVRAATPRWRIAARLKAPALLRLNDASLPPGAGTRPIGLTPSLLVRAGVSVIDAVELGVGGWAALSLPAPVALPDGRDAVLQPGLEARLTARVNCALTLFAEGAVAIGGPLDDTATLGIGAGWVYPD